MIPSGLKAPTLSPGDASPVLRGPAIPADVMEWEDGEPMEWEAGEYMQWGDA